jgi:hypothetical protein
MPAVPAGDGSLSAAVEVLHGIERGALG